MSDEYGNVELQSSSVKVLIPQRIENIVYKDAIDSLDARVKVLEKGGNLTAKDPNGSEVEDHNDFERRLAILEAKCKNIIIEDEPIVQSETLTLEERLQILERKCANIKIIE